MQKKYYSISKEVFKYPYCGIESNESEEFLSEKICRYTVNVGKKKGKGFVSGVLILVAVLINFPTQPNWREPGTEITRMLHKDISKKIIIAEVVSNTKPDKIIFNDVAMDALYNIAVKANNNRHISREEIILDLRAGGFKEDAATCGVILAMIIVLNNLGADGLMPQNSFIPPHLGWLYNTQKPGNNFGYSNGSGTRSSTATEMTQNAGDVNPELFGQRLGAEDSCAPQSKEVVRKITAHDGVTGEVTKGSSSHLVSKHGHLLGIDDKLPPNPNQRPTKYTAIRTRVNIENEKTFFDAVERIMNNPETQPFPDISIRGVDGHGYFSTEFGGVFIGIHNEGPLKGNIVKVQPVTRNQLETLKSLNKID